MTIVEFLEARIADDEAPAVAMIGESHDKWPANDFDGPKQDEEYLALHIGAGRVLREVAAKQAIMAEHWHEMLWNSWTPPVMYHSACARCVEATHWMDEDGGAMVDWPCPTIRALAAVYAGHPDYDPSWTVEVTAVRTPKRDPKEGLHMGAQF